MRYVDLTVFLQSIAWQKYSEIGENLMKRRATLFYSAALSSAFSRLPESLV